MPDPSFARPIEAESLDRETTLDKPTAYPTVHVTGNSR